MLHSGIGHHPAIEVQKPPNAISQNWTLLKTSPFCGFSDSLGFADGGAMRWANSRDFLTSMTA
jgi:hypothetical protein